MKSILKTAMAGAGLMALAACGGGADDKAADNIEAAAENRADALEDLADNTTNETLADSLEAQADNAEDAGKAKADAIDDADDPRLENKR